MRQRGLLLAFLILIVLVGYRQWWYRQWYKESVCLSCQVQWIVRIIDKPKASFSGYSLNYRGIKVVCPKTVAGCELVGNLQAGDTIELSGVAGETNGVSKIVKYVKLPITSIWWWIRVSQQLQTQIVNNYRLLLSEPYSGLLAGIVLGEQANLSPDLYQALVRTGTMHIVAASGYNISLVAVFLITTLVIFVHRRAAVWLAIGGVFMYVMAAGAGPAVVRAGIMGGLALLAQAFGKDYHAGWALAVTLLIMLIATPWMLTSVSFQLSVAATIGVIWGTPALNRILERHQKAKETDLSKAMGVVNGDFATTLSAVLITIPVTLIAFGQVSVISPLVNLLVLWMVPPLMILGGLTALLGMISVGLAQLTAYLTWPLLALFSGVISWFGSWPGALVTLDGVSWWWGVGWWVLLAVWWTRRIKSPDKVS